jgi:hypothetical protein
MTQTIILRGQSQRDFAKLLIDKAPDDAVIAIKPASRSSDQNSKMWAMLSDVSRSKPNGLVHTPEVWKALFMHSCGHQVQFENGLDGEPFPIGFQSSRLNKAQMAELIEWIYAYGSQGGILWSENYEG